MTVATLFIGFAFGFAVASLIATALLTSGRAQLRDSLPFVRHRDDTVDEEANYQPYDYRKMKL